MVTFRDAKSEEYITSGFDTCKGIAKDEIFHQWLACQKSLSRQFLILSFKGENLNSCDGSRNKLDWCSWLFNESWIIICFQTFPMWIGEHSK